MNRSSKREITSFDRHHDYNRLAHQVAVHWMEGEDSEALELLAASDLPFELKLVRSVLEVHKSDSILGTATVMADKLAEAIATPPKEANLFSALLMHACSQQLTLIQPAKARLYIDALGREDETKLDPLVRFWCCTGRAMYATAIGDKELKRRAEVSMLAAKLPRESQAWCAARFTNLRSAIDGHHTDAIDRLLKDLESQKKLVEKFRYGQHALAQLKLYWHYRCGRLSEALSIHDSLPDEPIDHNWTNTRSRTFLLIQSGCRERALELINRLRQLIETKKLVSRPGALLCLESAFALGNHDPALASQLAHQALTENPEATDARECRRLLVGAELAQRKPRAARMALGPQTLDFPEDAVLWARLAVLEERMHEAADMMRPIHDEHGLTFLAAQLTFAFEISAAQLATLLAMVSAKKPKARHNSVHEGIPWPSNALIGQSDIMQKLRRTLKRFADLDTTVLLQGETGTGKEIAAKLLHDQSQRRELPFLAVDCGAVSESLVESELFGHVKGAFTGATCAYEGLFLAAGEGTIFLDEINSMGPRLQASLLRVIETGEVRAVGGSRNRLVKARLILASNRKLVDEVAAGRFRADLYYRIERLVVTLPALRDRLEDIPSLIEFFLERMLGSKIPISSGLQHWLMAQKWPGNVRELRNLIERMVLLGGDAAVLDESLLPGIPPLEAPVADSPTVEQIFSLPGSHRPRLERLKELFQVHRTLTRSEIITLMECAPNTATKDLKLLERQAFIHRVVTSANLRTSYFAITGSSQA